MNYKDEINDILNHVIQQIQVSRYMKDACNAFVKPQGKCIVIAIGKAGYAMAKCVEEEMFDEIDTGICITKYHHDKHELKKIHCYEAGHPVVDEQSIRATQEIEKMVSNLTKEDCVLFLVSGGGSALFEDSYIPLQQLQNLTQQLLESGADINEINTIRKRLSKVKGGKFAKMCEPAHVYSIILSDVIGNRLDSIASGPTAMDTSKDEDVQKILDQYALQITEETRSFLFQPTVQEIDNVENHVVGSVDDLCLIMKKECEKHGYETTILSTKETGEAKDVGMRLAQLAKQHAETTKPLAYIIGGETVVHMKGQGLGGRNQELALSGAIGIDGMKNCAIFSFGSDGTDGPTDAAGGWVDGLTVEKLKKQGIHIEDVLENHDSYHGLEKCDGLFITGPTGTNLNDVSVVLISPNPTM